MGSTPTPIIFCQCGLHHITFALQRSSNLLQNVKETRSKDCLISTSSRWLKMLSNSVGFPHADYLFVLGIGTSKVESSR